MVRHYSAQRPTSRGQQPSPFKQWVWIVLAFALGYFFSTVYDLEHLKQWFTHTFSTHQTPQKPAEPTTAVTVAPKPKFEFYTLLAKESANVSASKAQANPTPPPASTLPAVTVLDDQQPKPATVVKETPQPESGSYVVQLAAFNQRLEADKMQAKLTLKGFQVTVMLIEQANLPRYRVMLGPFPTRQAAEMARNTVAQRERISGMIRKA